jgi:CDP-diacylglycerol--glycerol-3-phosphate 3-phosphatidyltransferase
MDQLCSLGLLVFLIVLWTTHAVRARSGVPQRIERVDLEGASALLSRGMLESLYSVIVPIGRACARLGVTPNAISGFSVLLAFCAGALFADDSLGLGSVFAVAAMGCDALDGFVARSSGVASRAGEVIDAAVDRCVELCLFAGLAVHLRGQPSELWLALAALGGSFLVSYSTAKAEALGVVPPRGSMRRTERAFLLILGAGLTPLTVGLGVPAPVAEAPLLIALVWLAVGTNVSAIARFSYVVRELRARDGRRPQLHGRDVPRAVSAADVADVADVADTLPVDQ